jgi:hypothetical protein
MADNLRQISKWTIKGQHKSQKENIKLFLKLTRKDVDELQRFPLPKAFVPAFKKFCTIYNRLEEEYHAGLKDHKTWGLNIDSCAQDISTKSSLV